MADESLDFLLNLDADVKGPQEALQLLRLMDQNLRRVDMRLEKVGAASHAAGNAHKKHAEHAGVLGRALHHLTGAALEPFLHKAKEIAEFEFIRRGVDAILEAPMELLHLVRELGEEMIAVAAKTERTEASFKLLFGDREGERMLGYFDGIAKATEFTDDNLKSAAQELAKVGFEGDALMRANAAALDIAAFSANPQQGQAEALSALERIKRTGRVEGRTLGGLGIGEQTFLRELSRRTGKGTAQLKKDMEAGKVSAGESLEALYTVITNKTHKALGGAGVALSETLSARLTHLRDLPEQYFEKLAHSSGFTRLSERVGKVLEGLDPDSPTGKRIFSALERVFNLLSDVLTKFDLAGAVASAIEELDIFSTAVLDLLSVLPGETGRKAAGISAQMKARRAEDARKRGEREGLEAADSAVSRTNANFYADFPAAERAEAIRKGYYRAVDDATPWLVKAGNKLGEATEKGSKDALGIHSPSSVYFDIARMSALGYTRGLDAHSPEIAEASERAFAPRATTPAGGGGGGGRVALNMPITIEVHGGNGSPDEIAAAVSSAAEAQFGALLQAALDRLGLSSGTGAG